MNLRALGNHVIIERDPVGNVTMGGIVLPIAKNEHKGLEWGTVREVGPGKNAVPPYGSGYTQLSVKRGDRVLFTAKKAVPIKTDDKRDFVSIEEEHIVAVEC